MIYAWPSTGKLRSRAYQLVQTLSMRADRLGVVTALHTLLNEEIEMRMTLRTMSFPRTLLGLLAVGCWLAFAIAHSAIAGIVPNTSTGLSDAEILGTYIQVNSFDLETALLGRAQASSDAVRALAAQVASDHLGVRQAAFDLAATCKVSPVLATSRAAAAVDHDRAMTRLLARTGVEFDKAYLEHEVAFHRAAIDAIRQTLQPAATCPSLKAHFKNILPALEQHRSQTETLASQTNPR